MSGMTNRRAARPTARAAALVATVLLALLVVAPAGAATTVPYKKYGTLTKTLKDYAGPQPHCSIKQCQPGYYTMKWHYKGTFPKLAKNEYIGYNGFYDGNTRHCYRYVFAGDMDQRRLTDPRMQPVMNLELDGGYYNHTFCVGHWHGQAQVYKQGKNEAHPVLTIARFDFKVDK